MIETAPRWIELERVECSPGPYCMSFGFALAPLVQSIRTVGLVNSPLLMENEHGRYRVISGYRRIRALRSLGWEKIPGRVVSESKCSPLECLLLNLYDNLATRKLNEVEKAMVLSRLEPLVSRNDLVGVYMPLLDLHAHDSILSFYTGLENELVKPIKESLAQGTLSLHVARKLLELDKAARTEVFNFMSTLKFNLNEQKQVIEYIIDISIAEKKPIPQLLNQASLKRIVSDPRKNNPQKAKSMLKLLRTQRFPRLVQAEKVFKKRISSLRLPSGVRIAAPPFFESPNYRLQVIFKDGMELKAKIERLSATDSLKRLKNPWEEG